MIYILSYDLHLATESKRETVKNIIENTYDCIKILTTTYFIESSLPSLTILRSISSEMTEGSKIIVAEMKLDSFTFDLDDKAIKWLNYHGATTHPV